LPTYDSLALDEVWRGIDVLLAMRHGGIERIFTLRPGANPARIQVAMEGIDSLQLRDDGTLAATVGDAELRLTAPRAWQVDKGVRRPVRVSYRPAGHAYGFVVGHLSRRVCG
jgi:hypothetical protein